MTATINITAEITEFAQKVREHLADLPADEVDDLTDGLEADLAESFAERPDFDFPEPGAYALELRNAAGLPPAEAKAGNGIRQSFGGVIDSLRLKREGLAANIRQSTFGAAALDILEELRPVWWVLRAWVAYQLVGIFFGYEGPALPSEFATWIILGVFVLISVQWGRHRWLPAKGVAGLILLGNIVAAIALLPSLDHANDRRYDGTSQYDIGYQDGSNSMIDEPQAGVQLNGKEVTNIFGYDASGKPLTGIQLFDQNGKPLSTSVPGGNGCLEAATNCNDGKGLGVWIPSILETGAKAWNVYPMQMQGAKTDDSTGELVADPNVKPEIRKSPYIKVPAVMPAPKADEKGDKGN